KHRLGGTAKLLAQEVVAEGQVGLVTKGQLHRAFRALAGDFIQRAAACRQLPSIDERNPEVVAHEGGVGIPVGLFAQDIGS
ncbi:hypothetical protein DF186_22775, partial [Enterococcus hirae]